MKNTNFGNIIKSSLIEDKLFSNSIFAGEEGGGGPVESPSLLTVDNYTGDASSSRGIQLSSRPHVVIALEYITASLPSVSGAPLAWHDGTPPDQYYTYGFGANFATSTLFFQSMSDDGVFTVGAGHNENNKSYRMIGFTAGLDYVVDTSGDITAEVNASVDKGFSHVKYTGNGTFGEAIPHGLGEVPDFIWFKGMGGYNTIFPREAMIQASRAGDSQYIQLGGTINTNYTAPTSDFFYTTTTVNNSSGIAYNAWCFKAVPGKSDFGYYTGNGSTNGPTVNIGFAPDFVIVGQVNASATQYYFDRQDADGGGNITYSALWNSTFGAHSQVTMRLTSTGFKITGTNTRINTSGGTYFYAAFTKDN